MRLLIPVDQKGSIAAGYDAPSSTETFDLPASMIPEDIRAYIATQYDPASGKLNTVPTPEALIPGYRRYYGTTSATVVPALQHPITTEAVVGWLRAYRQRHLDAVTKDYQSDQQKREEVRLATLSVLTARKTKTVEAHVSEFIKLSAVKKHSRRYEEVHPAWPYESDKSVRESAEAQAWQAELDKINSDRKDEAQRQLKVEIEQVVAKEAADEAERAQWIERYGSARLKRMVAEKLSSYLSLYENERLKADRPGWQWYDDVPGSVSEDAAIIPTDEDFTRLDEARRIAPDAKLVEYTVSDDDSDEESAAIACQAEFLGKKIVLLPAA